jgi:hypothetical protein
VAAKSSDLSYQVKSSQVNSSQSHHRTACLSFYLDRIGIPCHARSRGARTGSEPLLSRRPLVTSSKLPRMLKPLSPPHSPQFMPRSREQLMLTARRPRLTDTCRSVFKFPFLSLPMRRQWQYCAISNVRTGFQPHNATSATPFWPLKTRRPCHFRSHSFQSPPRIFHEPSPGLLERPKPCMHARKSQKKHFIRSAIISGI